MNKIFPLLFLLFGLNPLFANNLQVTQKGTSLTVGNARIESPAEGLWSIATDWGTNWPDSWQHANPERIA